MDKNAPIKPAKPNRPKQPRKGSTSRQRPSPNDLSDDKLVGNTSTKGTTEAVASVTPVAKLFEQRLDEFDALIAFKPEHSSSSGNTQTIDNHAYAKEHYVNNPLLCIQEIFPWKNPGTYLEFYDGPDTWQAIALETIRTNYCEATESLWYAIASGRGVGKTTLLVWTILWFILTRQDALIIVTASGLAQLSSVIWRELALWHSLSSVHQDFQYLKTMYRHSKRGDTWFAKAQPSNPQKRETFQGLHAEHMLIIMDEATSIDDSIWEAVQGNFSRGHGLWLAYSNPLYNTGRFRQCFPGGRFAHRWLSLKVDANDSKMADKEEIEKWRNDYGEDSDQYLVNVLGDFPHLEEGQYIGMNIIDEALKRIAIEDDEEPYIIGIDLGLSLSGDPSVILVRHGCRIVYKKIFREKSGSILRDRLVEVIDLFKNKNPYVFVDSVSGWGIMASMLQERIKHKGVSIEEVRANNTPDDPVHYDNKNSEIWARMKYWLEKKGCLDAKEENLISELIQRHYTYRGDELVIEPKKDMKKRGLSSGDEADALSFTFVREGLKKKKPVVEPFHETIYISSNGSRKDWRNTWRG